MQPVHADLTQTRTSHTGIDHRDQLWGYPTLKRLAQHGLLNASLLQP
jgi:hypothetical protein